MEVARFAAATTMPTLPGRARITSGAAAHCPGSQREALALPRSVRTMLREIVGTRVRYPIS